MKLDKRTTLAMFGFLIFVNFTFRFAQLGNHEEGSDSFLIHTLANTITNFGYAKWIIHPWSYFGFTPLSYPCAVPYLISGISQTTGTDMETSILIFSFATTLFGLGSAYLMAMEFKRDHLFAFIVAFSYSLSPIFIEYTMWQATTRSLFMAFLPLLVWSFLRTFGDRPKKNINIFFCILFFVVLGTVHHMFLLLPLFIIAYFSSIFIYNQLRKKRSTNHWLYRYQTIAITTVFIVLLIPQFSQQGIYSPVSWETYKTGLYFNGDAEYIIFLNLIIDYWSRTGFFAFFAIFGFFLLIYRPRKNISDILTRYKLDMSYSEIFLLFCLLMTIPFITMGVYVSLIFLTFMCVVIGYAVIKIINLMRKRKNILRTFFIIFIAVSLIFSVFMINHWDTYFTSRPMSEQSYATGIYVSENFENTSISNDGLLGNRISSISNLPNLPLGGAHASWYPPDLLVYDFANVRDYSFSRLSFETIILTQSDNLYTTKYGVNAKDDWISLMDHDATDKINDQYYNRYKIDCAIEYLPLEGKYFFWSIRSSAYFKSLETAKYIIYSNGEERVWLI
jgi:hypothetical protein